MIFLDIVILLAGFVALIKGADIFVDGSTGIARLFRVSGLVIGLTVVALGTSAPEMAVSALAAVQGSNEIAISNVLGSCLFNLLMVLGISAFIKPLPVESSVVKRDFPVFLLSAVFVYVVASSFRSPIALSSLGMYDVTGIMVRPASIALLIGFLVYLTSLIIHAGKNPEEDTGEEKIPAVKCVLMIIIGLILIVGGGQVVVNSAKNIARFMGLTETLIGLTVVSIGTSLPELITSIVAARKGETGLAVGNVIGSNIFNIMMIIGVSSAIHPIAANTASMWDLIILIAVTAMTWLFSTTGRAIGKLEGSIMILCYIGTIVFAAMR